MTIDEALEILAVGHNFDVIRDKGGYSVYNRFDTSSVKTRAFYDTALGEWFYEHVDDDTFDMISYCALRAYCEEDLPLILGLSWELIDWDSDTVRNKQPRSR